jgi:hypothetical protein
MKHHPHNFILFIPVLILAGIPGLADGVNSEDAPVLSDSLYTAHHPRLLLTTAELPTLQDKVRDGGVDVDAYALVRLVSDFQYPDSTIQALLGDDLDLDAIPNLGLAGYLEMTPDTSALSLGRAITVYIADSFTVDNDDFGSSLRLRSLALGYDMFFEHSTPADRDYLRSEIISYIDLMTTENTDTIFFAC